MPDRPIAFIDTETTSLRPDRRAWEIALILRQPGQDDVEHRWLISWADLDLGNADPAALRIGGFYERHPEANGEADRSSYISATGAHDEQIALLQVEELTRGAILMGSNPSFDAETLAARMRSHGICPSWHYRVEDVPTLAKGWLLGLGGRWEPLPAKSEEISKACGIDPQEYERHTALGDCHWIRDLYDRVYSLDEAPSAALAGSSGAGQEG